MEAVNLAEAKARLSELVGRALSGEDIQISRRGKPAVRLVAVEQPPEPFDWDELARFRETLPHSDLTVEKMRRLDML